jgi:hypothetical protein
VVALAKELEIGVNTHTVKRLDAWQIQFPSHVLSINFPEISNEKGVFVAWFADFMIDTFNPLLQGIPNYSLRSIGAMVLQI